VAREVQLRPFNGSSRTAADVISELNRWRFSGDLDHLRHLANPQGNIQNLLGPDSKRDA